MSMKVSNIKNTDPARTVSKGAEARSSNGNDSLQFKRTLTDLTQEAYIERLTEMKSKIEDQGKRLTERVDVNEYEKYRKLIREFIDEIVSNGYTFIKEDAYAARGKHRYIATVKIIDNKLDELGKEVMSDQADIIEILSKIDDIRGLLLDLMA